MAQQIQFIYLSQSAYDGLASKPSGRIYFTSDTKRIYKGEDLYAATTFDQLDFDSIEVNQLTVRGSAVSLEGHSHTTSDISDLASFISNATSGFASTGHSHVELSGITSSSIYKETATFGNLTVTGEVTMSLSEVTFGGVIASDIQVNGTSVALVGHSHSSSDIQDFASAVISAGTGVFASASHVHSMSEVQGLESRIVEVSCITQSQYDSLEPKVSDTIYFLTDTQRIYRGSVFFGGATMEELQCTSLSTSNLTVDGTPVSLEGHVHSASDISDFANAVVSAGTSVFASASHSHDGLQGLTSNSISKDVASFNSISASTATFDNLVVTGDVSLSLSQVQFGSIVASEISVNGSSVSLEGHLHSISDVSGLESTLSAIPNASLMLSGQTMPSEPTQNQLTLAVKTIWQALGGGFE